MSKNAPGKHYRKGLNVASAHRAVATAPRGITPRIGLEDAQ